MVQDRAIVALADQYKVEYGLSNGAIFNDLAVTSKPDFIVTILFNVK